MLELAGEGNPSRSHSLRAGLAAHHRVGDKRESHRAIGEPITAK